MHVSTSTPCTYTYQESRQGGPKARRSKVLLRVRVASGQVLPNLLSVFIEHGCGVGQGLNCAAAPLIASSLRLMLRTAQRIKKPNGRTRSANWISASETANAWLGRRTAGRSRRHALAKLRNY